MKNYKNPEFFILHELQILQEQYPDIPELAKLVNKVHDVINENAVSIAQQASLYSLLGKPGDIRPDTKGKLRQILAMSQNCLDLDDDIEK